MRAAIEFAGDPGSMPNADPLATVADPAERDTAASSARQPSATMRAITLAASGTDLRLLGGLLWAAGAVAVGLWFAIGWAASALTARRCAAAPAAWGLEIADLRSRLRIPREVDLRMLPQHTSPIALGIWRPIVLLPAMAAAWSEDRRRSVLLHELAHVQRRDCRVQAIAQIACAMHWFN